MKFQQPIVDVFRVNVDGDNNFFLHVTTPFNDPRYYASGSQVVSDISNTNTLNVTLKVNLNSSFPERNRINYVTHRVDLGQYSFTNGEGYITVTLIDESNDPATNNLGSAQVSTASVDDDAR